MIQFQWVNPEDNRVGEYVKFISEKSRKYKEKYLYLPLILSPGRQVLCFDDSSDCFLLMVHTENPAEFEAPAAYYFHFKGVCFLFNAVVIDGDDMIVFNVFKLDDVCKDATDEISEIKVAIKAFLECLAKGFYISRIAPDDRGIMVNFDGKPMSIDYSNSAR